MSILLQNGFEHPNLEVKLASLCKTHFQEKGTTNDDCQRETTKCNPMLSITLVVK